MRARMHVHLEVKALVHAHHAHVRTLVCMDTEDLHACICAIRINWLLRTCVCVSYANHPHVHEFSCIEKKNPRVQTKAHMHVRHEQARIVLQKLVHVHVHST